MASHFLGGSFTYRHIQTQSGDSNSRTILVEIRFHLSNHYFLCTPAEVNEHTVVYLLGSTAPYDARSKTYQWFEVDRYRENSKYYDLSCHHGFFKSKCDGFKEKMWGYCESANQISGYSIGSCCWADSMHKMFFFELNIEKEPLQNNSSPYPHIPASYYVDIKKPTDLKVFAFDADGDEIICQQYDNDLKRFLTVHIDKNCKLSYQTNRIGRQFGQFWLIDRRRKIILSKSLISIQVHVLSNIVCNTPPKLIIKYGAQSVSEVQCNIRESVYLTVSLHPNCQSIQPQDQTITELTTLCTNNQPEILADGGISMAFQCTPQLCEKYQVCFVGEFGLKLPSTTLECLLIQVVGDTNDCAQIATKHDFIKPRSRQFVILQPMSQNSIANIPKTVSTSSKFLPIMPTKRLLSLKLTDRISLTSSSTTPKPASKSQSWLWISAALLVFTGFGLIAYYGLKPKSAGFKRASSTAGKFNRTSADDNRSLSGSEADYSDLNIENPNPPAIDDSHGSSFRDRGRGHHVRLAAFDEDDL